MCDLFSHNRLIYLMSLVYPFDLLCVQIIRLWTIPVDIARKLLGIIWWGELKTEAPENCVQIGEPIDRWSLTQPKTSDHPPPREVLIRKTKKYTRSPSSGDISVIMMAILLTMVRIYRIINIINELLQSHRWGAMGTFDPVMYTRVFIVPYIHEEFWHCI